MSAIPQLKPTITTGAEVTPLGVQGWRFEIPSGPAGRYRLAQLDDYGDLPRSKFPWRPPFRLSLRARASHADIPGTWGFGLWNNPFGMSILSGVEILSLPALPDAAWFFHASPQNYLSLRDDVPAHGFLAATFRAPRLPAPLLALAGPFLPLLLIRPILRLARRVGRSILQHDAARLSIDVTGWHTYEIDCQPDRAIFRLDAETILETGIVPRGSLGLVLWIDNQYAAIPPSGKLSFGTLPSSDPAWIEIEGLQVLTGKKE